MLNEYFVNVVNCLSSVHVSGDLEVHSGNIVTALYVEDGLVGINTETPNKELTVNGSISSNASIYASGDLEVHSGNIVTALYVEDGLVGINTETPNKELTVNGSISSNASIYASYFQGIFIDWMTLTRGYKTEPVFNSSIGTGDVYDYVYSTSSTDKTYYRYIATDGREDSYYENFSGGILSNLIAKKQIII